MSFRSGLETVCMWWKIYYTKDKGRCYPKQTVLPQWREATLYVPTHAHYHKHPHYIIIVCINMFNDHGNKEIGRVD